MLSFYYRYRSFVIQDRIFMYGVLYIYFTKIFSKTVFPDAVFRIARLTIPGAVFLVFALPDAASLDKKRYVRLIAVTGTISVNAILNALDVGS